MLRKPLRGGGAVHHTPSNRLHSHVSVRVLGSNHERWGESWGLSRIKISYSITFENMSVCLHLCTLIQASEPISLNFPFYVRLLYLCQLSCFSKPHVFCRTQRQTLLTICYSFPYNKLKVFLSCLLSYVFSHYEDISKFK